MSEVEAQTPLEEGPPPENTALRIFRRLPALHVRWPEWRCHWPELRSPLPPLRPRLVALRTRLPAVRWPQVHLGNVAKAARRRWVLSVVCVALTWLSIAAVYKQLNPNSSWHTEAAKEEARWIATSNYWLDRMACRVLGLCGIFHFRKDPAYRGTVQYYSDPNWTMKTCAPFDDECPYTQETVAWVRNSRRHAQNRSQKAVPQFVIDHAPVVHLYSQEYFWPSDLNEHLQHVIPLVNFTDVNGVHGNATLDNLDRYNQHGEHGEFIYLTAIDDIEERPDWLWSDENIPAGANITFPPTQPPQPPASVKQHDENVYGYDNQVPWSRKVDVGKASKGGSPLTKQGTKRWLRRPQLSDAEKLRAKRSAAHTPRPDGYSSAPVYLILVEKPDGIVDAFWFYFYSYNLGTTVLGMRFGNHVGDWEHTMVRFQHGKPKEIFLSEHSWGQSFHWDAIQKWDKDPRRPLTFSASGSHAMYANAGKHNYAIPFGLLSDRTDYGPLWDPVQNFVSYNYDLETYDLNQPMPSEGLTPTKENPHAPTSWFHFSGRWGDKYYDLGDRRQYRFVGEYHYAEGPEGPKFKDLDRVNVCQFNKCHLYNNITQVERRNWLGLGG